MYPCFANMAEKGTYLFVVYIDSILKLSMIVSVSKLVLEFTTIISHKTINFKKKVARYFFFTSSLFSYVCLSCVPNCLLVVVWILEFGFAVFLKLPLKSIWIPNVTYHFPFYYLTSFHSIPQHIFTPFFTTRHMLHTVQFSFLYEYSRDITLRRYLYRNLKDK